MAKQNVIKSKGVKVGNDIIAFCIANRDDVPTNNGYTFSKSVEILDGVLHGGTSKLISAMKQAGLSEDEIEQALA